MEKEIELGKEFKYFNLPVHRIDVEWYDPEREEGAQISRLIVAENIEQAEQWLYFCLFNAEKGRKHMRLIPISRQENFGFIKHISPEAEKKYYKFLKEKYEPKTTDDKINSALKD